MIAGIYNVDMEQGSTFERVLRVLDALDAAYDFTGYTFRMKIRNSAGVVIWDSTTPNSGGEITLQNVNELLWRIEAETTATFKFDVAKYDLEMIIGSNVYKLVRGKIQLIREQTR